MAQYAILNADGTFHEYREFPSDPTATQVKAGRWRPVVIGAQPVYDPATHRVQEIHPPVITAQAATRTFQAVALSAAEIEILSDGTKLGQYAGFLNNLEAGTASNANAQKALALVIRHLLRHGVA